MSEEVRHKYPSAFRYGFGMGVCLQLVTRVVLKESYRSRPFSYLTVGLSTGFIFMYYDWFKRKAIEDVLYGEEEAQYHNMVKAMNNVRVGEEEEIENMVDYLTGTTTRV